MIQYKIMYLLLLLIPNITFASFDSFFSNVVNQIVNPLIGFVFALAVLYFLYGVVKFIMSMDSEGGRDEGKKHMMWGIVGITIMMGVWGIMNLILNTLNIDYIDPENNEVNLPN